MEKSPQTIDEEMQLSIAEIATPLVNVLEQLTTLQAPLPKAGRGGLNFDLSGLDSQRTTRYPFAACGVSSLSK